MEMETLEVRKLDLEAMPWTYRGEGNANIVLGLDNELHVIRLIKDLKDQDHESDKEQERHQARLVREVNNMNNILKRLINPGLLGTVQIAEISQEQVKALNEKLKSIRPENRLHKKIGFTQGTIRSDLARMYTKASDQVDYCVEIKLKQGWFDKASPLSQESNLCNFCLHQFLKLRQGKAKGRSNYCPLDLFSGAPDRMIYALVSLLQNPQNNLKIFRNGVVTFDERMADNFGSFLKQWCLDFKIPSDSLEQEADDRCSYEIERLFVRSRSLKCFLFLLCSALIAPLNQEEDSKSKQLFQVFESKLKELIIESSENVLVSNNSPKLACNVSSDNNNRLPDCVLSKVLFLQSLSQELPSSIFEVYKKICPVHVPFLCEEQNASNTSCPSESCFASEVWFDEVKKQNPFTLDEEEESRLQNFLLSATAKDCSLLVTISSNDTAKKELKQTKVGAGDQNSPTMFELNDLFADSTYIAKLGLADMDIKPVTCIPKQCIRDCDMLKSFKEVNTVD